MRRQQKGIFSWRRWHSVGELPMYGEFSGYPFTHLYHKPTVTSEQTYTSTYPWMKASSVAYSQCRPHQWALSSLSLSSLPSSPPSSSDWSPSRSKVGLLTPSTSSRTGAMLCRLSSAESPMAGRARVLAPPISVLELLLLPLPLPSPVLPGSWPSGLLSLESCRSMATVPETCARSHSDYQSRDQAIRDQTLHVMCLHRSLIMHTVARALIICELDTFIVVHQVVCLQNHNIWHFSSFGSCSYQLWLIIRYMKIGKAMNISNHPARPPMWELHNSDSCNCAAV